MSLIATTKRTAQRGFTLIELMIVVVIIGILAALAIYGVQKYVASAKSAEARSFLGRISKDAQAKFDGEQTQTGVTDLGDNAVISRTLCTSHGATVPAAQASISGRKYQSTPNDWAPDAMPVTQGFKCLKSSLVDPQYFMYGYEASVSDPLADGDGYTASAQGDLDGDGNLSLFTLPGEIQEDTTNDDLVLTAAATVTESNPEE